MYHWLLAGGEPAVDGASCSVKTSFSAAGVNRGSATKSCCTSTRGSGGRFGAASPLSVIASTPGRVHGSGATTTTGATSEQYALSPCEFTAVTRYESPAAKPEST